MKSPRPEFHSPGSKLRTGLARSLHILNRHRHSVVIDPERREVIFHDCLTSAKKISFGPEETAIVPFEFIRSVSEEHGLLTIKTREGQVVLRRTIEHYELLKSLLYLIADKMPVEDLAQQAASTLDNEDMLIEQDEESLIEVGQSRSGRGPVRFVCSMFVFCIALNLVGLMPVAVTNENGATSARNSMPFIIVYGMAVALCFYELFKMDSECLGRAGGRLRAGAGLVLIAFPIGWLSSATETAMVNREFFESGSLFGTNRVYFEELEFIRLDIERDGDVDLRCRNESGTETRFNCDAIVEAVLPELVRHAQRSKVELVNFAHYTENGPDELSSKE